MSVVLSPELLRAATGCTLADAERFAQHLDAACSTYGIDTSVRLAAFMAQVGHESGSLRYVREIASGAAYEGRADLGNTVPGDGIRYAGRGLIQTTGRANYRRTYERLRARLGDDVPDFEAFPDALEEPRWACWSAADYWDGAGLNALADTGTRDDYIRIGRRINRGSASSTKPANGEEDRLRRWRIARDALAARQAAAGEAISAVPASAPSPDRAASPAASMAAGEGADAPELVRLGPEPPSQPAEPAQEQPMAPIVAAVLPSIVQAIPRLAELFGTGSQVAQRNVKAAEAVVGIVTQAVGGLNAQDAAERLATDPQARAAAAQAVEAQWYVLTAEAGGGGIKAAREADLAAQEAGRRPWQSPSMWALLLLLPLAYMVVGSVVGLWGAADWSPDVRAAISTAVVSLIIGGAAGYYWGATTTRNRPQG